MAALDSETARDNTRGDTVIKQYRYITAIVTLTSYSWTRCIARRAEPEAAETWIAQEAEGEVGLAQNHEEISRDEGNQQTKPTCLV